MLKRSFKCQFCEKGFTRRSWYDKHVCEKKNRFMEQHNVVVIQAHRMFNLWQKTTGFLKKGKEKTMDEFSNSPFYMTFKKLAVYCDQQGMHISAANSYVEWLAKHNIPAKDWEKAKTLELFRGDSVKTVSPVDQAKHTREMIREWCKMKNVDESKFFLSITPGQAINMLKQDQLSPWVLFGLDQSVNELLARFDQESLNYLNEHINLVWWLQHIREHPETIKRIEGVFHDDRTIAA